MSARYFLHLYKGDEVIRDEVGVEVSEFDHVRDAFVQIIWEMRREIDMCELDRWEVRVVDSAGVVVAKLRLSELRYLTC